MHHYWFKPKKFGIFAGYYPVTWQGWAVLIICAFFFVAAFLYADSRSHSVSDTLISFAPFGVIILLIFDLISFRAGEYPWWWKKRGEKNPRN